MIVRSHVWKLLRIKTDEGTDDPDWARTQATPTEPVGGAAILATTTAEDGETRSPITDVELIIYGTDANGVIVDRGAPGAQAAVDVTLIEVHPRDKTDRTIGPAISPAWLDAVSDSETRAGQVLNKPFRVPLNGAEKWTLRITNDVNFVGVDRLQVWYRESSF